MFHVKHFKEYAIIYEETIQYFESEDRQMAKLTRADFMAKVKTVIGDRTDDEAISFLEDCKDTIEGDKDDWKAKYDEAVKAKEELDKQWREKYTNTFFSPVSHNNESTNENNKNTNPANVNRNNVDEEQEKIEQAEKIRFDDLFKSE